ncbi:TIGR03084 family metal-binding protein [Actinomadura sp. ATCC 31491]|uniref:TIGR03084 family metal-binding protein n=1 Tax=Actinomadura luzonensis TaxID=2805427 RepID=A0ABT0FZ66_9ACTN|nr:TIGR03084 family metal-binding protein [Actinomadura luzonensis]MCK2217443.1 TIGR03084 family metal-binding protein [Actinomadura luzonensis]
MDLMAELLDDLRAETASLEELLEPLGEADWELATPAAGWAVRDQVSHLAWFDDAAVLAVTDPDAFAATLTGLGPVGDAVDDLARQARGMPPAELLAWFRAARARSLEVFAGLGARDRVPWFGPPMSAASFVTARLMETWAHGQDVADALGVVRPPTDRLRHVAALGYRARPYSFAVRGLPVPAEPVRVELAMPGGGTWTAGPPDAASVVRGPLLGFCLAVTQRAHLSDTGLELTGEAARAWLPIAQAFAGPPGKGRPPRASG